MVTQLFSPNMTLHQTPKTLRVQELMSFSFPFLRRRNTALPECNI
jgi:hypothetical protein